MHSRTRSRAVTSVSMSQTSGGGNSEGGSVHAILRKLNLKNWSSLLNPVFHTDFDDPIPDRSLTTRQLDERRAELVVIVLDELIRRAYGQSSASFHCTSHSIVHLHFTGSTHGYVIVSCENMHNLDPESLTILRSFLTFEYRRCKLMTFPPRTRRFPFLVVGLMKTMIESPSRTAEVMASVREMLLLPPKAARDLDMKVLNVCNLSKSECCDYIRAALNVQEVSEEVMIFEIC